MGIETPANDNSGETPMENKPWTKDEVLKEISMLHQEVGVTGAGDTEQRALEVICDDLKSGALTPEEGLTRARGIMKGRQDYH
jgi:hypothetical protein